MSGGQSLSAADVIFLFHRLISFDNYHINLGNFRVGLHGERVSISAPAYNGQEVSRRHFLTQLSQS